MLDSMFSSFLLLGMIDETILKAGRIESQGKENISWKFFSWNSCLALGCQGSPGVRNSGKPRCPAFVIMHLMGCQGVRRTRQQRMASLNFLLPVSTAGGVIWNQSGHETRARRAETMKGEPLCTQVAHENPCTSESPSFLQKNYLSPKLSR